MSRKVRTVELPEAAGFSCDVGFANCRSAHLTLHGDACIVAIREVDDGIRWMRYATVELGPVSAAECYFCDNNGRHDFTELGSDELGSKRLLLAAGVHVGYCAWCRDGEVYSLDTEYCDRCLAGQCECGAFPGGGHYDDCDAGGEAPC